MKHFDYIIEEDNRPFFSRYPLMSEDEKRAARKAIELSILKTKHNFNQNELHDLRQVPRTNS